MGMQVIPTFKSMDLKTPMTHQQMLLKRNQDYIQNLLTLITIQEGADPKNANIDDNDYNAIREEAEKAQGRKRLTDYGLGWINNSPHFGLGTILKKQP